MNAITRRIVVAGLTAFLIIFTSAAQAGKSYGSRSFSSSSSKGSAVRSSPRPSSSGPIRYKSAVPESAAGRTSYSSGSVLSRSKNLPSEKLQTVIREKESSGPGWFGTGMLIWLLSQHDLSSSDRAWIKNQIDEAKKEGEAVPPPPPDLSDVVFNWAFPSEFIPGKKAMITVTANQGTTEKQVAISCVMNGVYGIKEGGAVHMEWTPEKNMSAVMRCNAAGLSDLRIFTAGNVS
jgi:hypothetical protein